MSSPLQEILSSLPAQEGLRVSGLHLSSCAYLCERLLSAPESDQDHPFVLLVDRESRARQLHRDTSHYLGRERAAGELIHLQAHDINPYSEVTPDRGTLRQRMAGLYRLASTERPQPKLVILSIESLMRRVLPRDTLLAGTHRIDVGDELDRDDLNQELIDAGYMPSSLVEEAGQVSVRGSVIDLFVPLYRFPLRIELFGDEVESIRHFDPDKQRTLRTIETALIHPVRETYTSDRARLRERIFRAADDAHHPSKATRQLLERIEEGGEFVGIETLSPAFHERLASALDYLPPVSSGRWLLFEPGLIRRTAEDIWEQAEERYKDRIDAQRIAFRPNEHYLRPEELSELLEDDEAVELQALQEHDPLGHRRLLHLSTDDNVNLRGQLERKRKTRADDLAGPLIEAIAGYRDRGMRVTIACASAQRQARLAALFREHDVVVETPEREGIDPLAPVPGGAPQLVRGELSEGFGLPDEGIQLITDDEIFGLRRHNSSRQRRAAKRAREALKGGVADFAQLKEDDYLVHTVHGIGQYKGLKKLPIQGVPIDFLLLEYNGGNLYLPVVRIGEVQRYIGAEGISPRLDKLGGQSFEKSKRKASKKIRALAEELLQLYAQRAALPGHAFPEPDELYREFEAAFEFDETPDQQKAIDEVAEDMGQSKAMDRLVCGDVGYGKTEVAMRAVLRAVFGGKQVAFLAPTTVLVEQHYQTMKRRFDRWPVRIARLSRFQSKKEQVQTVKDIATGSVDVVVGTHRLLSADIRFKELGLLVVDEEQRFGVTHKERLKKMRATIDVLTLTATPIPRTLHLAMTGLRDLSIIATPPADRRSIRTFVARPEESVLRDGIRKELDRKGQVFFVAPRINAQAGSSDRSLEEWGAVLQRLVPQARIAIAHGQMPADKLEKVMIDFVAGEFDILVSTTIVEAGLDISRANTMFVARADRFGLSQLYQLRGRIGRGHQRAYCYLLVPAPEKLSDDARRRLETLQRYTELGAGFAIASQDLEIRGAGDLLGAKQSGSIAAIGFDAYTEMLEEAVAELRGAPLHRPRDPELNVDLPGYIPDDYIPDTRQRLATYKRLAQAEDLDEIKELLEELADCYGPLPAEVSLLADLMHIKGLARQLYVRSLELNATRLALALDEHTPLEPAAIAQLVAKNKSSYALTPDMRLIRKFDKTEAKQPVETARAALMELVACATPMTARA